MFTPEQQQAAKELRDKVRAASEAAEQAKQGNHTALNASLYAPSNAGLNPGDVGKYPKNNLVKKPYFSNKKK